MNNVQRKLGIFTLCYAVSQAALLWSTASPAQAQVVNTPYCLAPNCNAGARTFSGFAAPAPLGGPLATAIWMAGYGSNDSPLGLLVRPPLPAREPPVGAAASTFALPYYGVTDADPSLSLAFESIGGLSLGVTFLAGTVDRTRLGIQRAPLIFLGLRGSTSSPHDWSDPVVRCGINGCFGAAADDRNNLLVVFDGPTGHSNVELLSGAGSGSRAARPALVRTDPTHFVIARKQYNTMNGTSVGVLLSTIDAPQMAPPRVVSTETIALLTAGDAGMYGSVAATLAAPNYLLIAAIQARAGVRALYLLTVDYPVVAPVTVRSQVLIPLPVGASDWVGLAHSNNAVVATVQIAGAIRPEPLFVHPATGAIALRFGFATGTAINDPNSATAIAHSLVDGPLPLATFDATRPNAPTRRALASIVGSCVSDEDCQLRAAPPATCGHCVAYECVEFANCVMPPDDGPSTDAAEVDVPNVDVPNIPDSGVLADVPSLADQGSGDDASSVDALMIDVVNSPHANANSIQFSGGSCNCRTSGPTTPAHNESTPRAFVWVTLSIAAVLARRGIRARAAVRG